MQPPVVLCKKAPIKNFIIFTGKIAVLDLFLSDLKSLFEPFRPATLLKRETLTKLLPGEHCEFSRTLILKSIYKRLLFSDLYFGPCQISMIKLFCEKCPYSELYWSVFSRIRTEYPNADKYGTG